MAKTIVILSLLLAASLAQLIGKNQPEVHPNLPTKICRKGRGCETQSTSIVLDANWRWLHSADGYTNCYTGNSWDKNLCPDSATCSRNCALEGVSYEQTYGIRAQGDALTLKFVTKGQYGDNIGSRVFLMSNENNYTMFKLKNQEFTFDVDVSNLPCGLNGALYFVGMDGDGGKSKYPTNKAGAKYGTGYCDAQCPHDLKFINGQANVDGWVPSPKDKNAGSGKYGTCCSEMDIWEANSQATAYTPHACTTPESGSFRCTGLQCGDGDNRYKGVCDKDGCDFNSYRQGDKDFFGSGKKVDTKQKFTVVTQFITRGNIPNGELIEIRRKYLQNGQVIANSKTNIPGMKSYDSISDNFCSDQKKTFGDPNDFQKKGGMKGMGSALDRGMVLVMSLWDDHDVNMLWLDSSFPLNKPADAPGVTRGPCSTDSGKPSDVEANFPDSSVTYSNIRWGDIDSTYN